MPKQIQNVVTKVQLLSWLHKYRIKLALSLFLIVTPVFSIAIGYITPYRQSTRVSFDPEITDESVFIRNFKSLDELEDITLYFSWITLMEPIENQDGTLSGGSMTFRIQYEIENNKDINNLFVTPVLQPLYTNIRDVGQQKVILPFGDTDFTIPHNLLYPFNPLFLVQLNDPILYLKITYKEILNDKIDPVTVTEYIRIPLDAFNPTNVNE
jgi:hypothetical protein